MDDSPAIAALGPLGFTRVEAEIYVYLLEHGPCTGYAVAQGLGKAAAGAYKVLDALTARGAVEVGDGTARLYRPVPSDELLTRLAHTFEGHREQARRVLSELRPAAGDDRIWHLDRYDTVLSRQHDMLGRAQVVALMDLFPALVDTFAPSLEAAAERGVEVFVQVYRPVELNGPHVLVARADGDRITGTWRGAWANLVIDAGEHLLAYLDPERRLVRQAVWSQSQYLGLLYHSGLSSEMRARAAEWALDHPEEPELNQEARRLFERLRRCEPSAVHQTLDPPEEP